MAGTTAQPESLCLQDQDRDQTAGLCGAGCRALDLSAEASIVGISCGDWEHLCVRQFLAYHRETLPLLSVLL